jgi:hypothetical protein
MEDNIIDAVVRQIKEDLYHNDTEALEEMLKLLYNRRNHEVFKQYLPEEIWDKYEKYDDTK